MFISRRAGLLAAVFSAGLAFGSPVAAESLTDAIALAYQTNPTLQAQRATLRALDESTVQARSGWRPSLSASASGQYTETRTPQQSGATLVDSNGDGIPDTAAGSGIVERNAAAATFNLSQPIWTGGRVASAVSAAQADVLAGQENLRRIEAEVLGGVIVAYVDVRRDIEALRIRQDNVQVLSRQLEESDARFEVGEITRTDVAQSQARLAAAEAQMRSAEAQLAISRASYASIVGQNPGDLEPEPPLAPILPPSVEAAFEAAAINNPQVRQAMYNAQAAEARVAGARAERMPNVGLNASLGWSGLAEPFEPSDYSRNITGRATLTVPLFDLDVGDGGLEMGVPVHQPLVAIDQAFLMELDEHLADGGRQPLVQGEALAAPVAGGAQAAQLVDDGPAGLGLPFPDFLDERLAAHVAAADVSGLGQLALDNVLGGDARMVGARQPQGGLAPHPLKPDQHVLKRVVQRMADVQGASHVRRRNDDGERLGVRIVGGGEGARLLPGLIEAGFGGLGIEGFFKHGGSGGPYRPAQLRESRMLRRNERTRPVGRVRRLTRP